MKASELMAIWKNFGLKKEQEIHIWLGAVLEEVGDVETRTTPELIKASIMCEVDGITFMPPDPTCPSCNDVEECDKDWVDGHRFNWWICLQCTRVMPCRHQGLDDISELDLTATCSECRMRMPRSFVADYLHKKYGDKAGCFLQRADICRVVEKEEREWRDNPPVAEMAPVSPELKDNWGL
jgi:hypothetical protein